MVSSLQIEAEGEKPLSEGPPPEVVFSVPAWLRHTAAILLAIGFIGSAFLLVSYFSGDKPKWNPAEIDLLDFLIFCILGLVLCALPWERYQFRIRRIGPVEIEQILSAQARERDEDLHEIRQRIKAMEKTHRGLSASNNKPVASKSTSHDRDLVRLLKKFLATNKRAFSPVRISSWGVQQPGFSKLGDYSPHEIRRALHELVAKNELETTVSLQGNTLYRLPKVQK